MLAKESPSARADDADGTRDQDDVASEFEAVLAADTSRWSADRVRIGRAAACDVLGPETARGTTTRVPVAVEDCPIRDVPDTPDTGAEVCRLNCRLSAPGRRVPSDACAATDDRTPSRFANLVISCNSAILSPNARMPNPLKSSVAAVAALVTSASKMSASILDSIHSGVPTAAAGTRPADLVCRCASPLVVPIFRRLTSCSNRAISSFASLTLPGIPLSASSKGTPGTRSISRR